jgi:hypothetical protein
MALEFALWETIGMAIKKCLMVPCPKCGVKPGEACKLVGKWKGSPANMCHDERVALSKEDSSQAAFRIVREATEGK